ncbi:MAG: potassium-transporting ATPase subunit F [Oscillatoriales cyanobacterium SM2_2_1]|nr:potassium-transporting ATPase subunit F [Oscillatoriales cyanobacterium SM2_2_1]
MHPKITPCSKLIFLGLLLNLAIAPALYAANNQTLGRDTAYAIGLLLILVLSLAGYLVWVIVQPERF